VAIGAVAGVTALLVLGGTAAVLVTRSMDAPSSRGSASALASASTSSSQSPSSSSSAAPSPQPTGVRPVTSATQGTVVYSDDFTDSASGWGTLSLPSGTRFAYSGGRYVVVAKGSLHHYSYAPYQDPVSQISVTAAYVVDAAKAGRSGVGVSCDQGEGKKALLYEFLVFPGGQWFIEEVRGAISTDPPTKILKQGPAGVKAGRISVTGVCTTSADGARTALALFINGRVVGRATSVLKVPGDGWLAGIDVASVAGKAQTVAIELVTVRDTNG
jgi:hypothetical protein